MLQPKPKKKPGIAHACETCDYRVGDFEKDTVNEEIIRVYCRARHFKVDAEAMAKDCDFFALNPEYIRPKEEDNKYGL